MFRILFLTLCMLWSAGAYTAGEWYSKKWSLNPSVSLTCCVVLSYALAQIGWLPALRMHGQLSILTVIWSLAAVICGVLVGVCIFGEALTYRQFFGMGLAAMAMVLLF